ncbi:hypothetical protein ACFLV0_00610 [Chloroflexota bacterium]
MTGEEFSTIVRGTLPFWGAIMVVVALLTAFPQLALWLPEMLF